MPGNQGLKWSDLQDCQVGHSFTVNGKMYEDLDLGKPERVVVMLWSLFCNPHL